MPIPEDADIIAAYPVFPVAVVPGVCVECGAEIADQAKHVDWHEKIDQALLGH